MASLNYVLDDMEYIAKENRDIDTLNAIYGIRYALATGRLHGYAHITLEHLEDDDVRKLVGKISRKKMLQGDVPRYLNQEFVY